MEGAPYLLCDKYQPRTIDELQCHKATNAALRRLGAAKEVPHLILYGPSGGGKRTRLNALLRELIGPAFDKKKCEVITVDDPKRSSLEFQVIGSPYHNEIFVDSLGFKDRQCVCSMVKQLSGSHFAKQGFKYRVFVLHEAQKLSLPAQASLRRIMEKYTKTSRIFLLCDNISSIIAPLKSRCYCIRVPLPQTEEGVEILRNICIKENAKSIPDEKLASILDIADHNLRVALIILQRMLIKSTGNASIADYQASWRKAVTDVVKVIHTSPSVATFISARNAINEMLVARIDGQMILNAFVEDFLRLQRVSDLWKKQVIATAAHYSHQMAQGSKETFFLEAFVSVVMVALTKPEAKSF